VNFISASPGGLAVTGLLGFFGLLAKFVLWILWLEFLAFVGICILVCKLVRWLYRRHQNKQVRQTEAVWRESPPMPVMSRVE
jgi:membrane protein implicated in regulation of membrane protease activity